MQLTGGRVSASSEGLGRGAEFLLYWPQCRGAVMSEPVYRVLVVEDDPHLAAGVVENLRAEGYQVDSVADGRKAVDWFELHSCDLIVLDVMLPGMDGFAVCSTLRGRAHDPGAVSHRARRCRGPHARPGGRR